jgi:predicted deacylase
MTDNITQITGIEPGPTSMILVGTHGDEQCGVRALEKILPTFQIQRGTVMFGFGNPRAITFGVRRTDADLNRMFQDEDNYSDEERASYEYLRALELKPFLNRAEVLLDVHASTVPDSRAFVICESNAQEIAKCLPVKTVVSGFDEVEPGGTDYYMNRMGKIGICIECGYTGDSRSVEIAEEGIYAFLTVRGHISGDVESREQLSIKMFEKYYTQSDYFVLAKSFDNFEFVEAGQLIGLDGVTEIRAPRRCVILFARNRQRAGDEAFLLGVEK